MAQVSDVSENDGPRLANIPIVLPHETRYGNLETSAKALSSCENIAPTSIAASSYFGNNNPKKAIDGDSSTRWATLGSSSRKIIIIKMTAQKSI
jgi:hypothetical protein